MVTSEIEATCDTIHMCVCKGAIELWAHATRCWCSHIHSIVNKRRALVNHIDVIDTIMHIPDICCVRMNTHHWSSLDISLHP